MTTLKRDRLDALQMVALCLSTRKITDAVELATSELRAFREDLPDELAGFYMTVRRGGDMISEHASTICDTLHHQAEQLLLMVNRRGPVN